MKRIFTFLVIPFIFSIASTLKVSAQNDCNCWQQRDTTFHYVPFDQSLCTSECGGDVAPYYRNDDGATNLIILPFNFCFWGVNTDSVYINTNGNLTFGKYGAGYTTFSPDTFPQLATVVPPMIAPFWGDVDIVGVAGGTDEILYKITPHYMIVQWDSVRYYNHEDPNKLNSFQVIITDGT
ncbi:MAG TPA: nidogen-like domain-containing protein, partial [Bacteroidia bacterium]|nr:nidogen-like domain-containing protein [Bacteroidia bacterium]